MTTAILRVNKAEGKANNLMGAYQGTIELFKNHFKRHRVRVNKDFDELSGIIRNIDLGKLEGVLEVYAGQKDGQSYFEIVSKAEKLIWTDKSKIENKKKYIEAMRKRERKYQQSKNILLGIIKDKIK